MSEWCLDGAVFKSCQIISVSPDHIRKHYQKNYAICISFVLSKISMSNFVTLVREKYLRHKNMKFTKIAHTPAICISIEPSRSTESENSCFCAEKCFLSNLFNFRIS